MTIPDFMSHGEVKVTKSNNGAEMDVQNNRMRQCSQKETHTATAS